MAEGSFFIKNNNDGCFQLKQRIHTSLFESFKLVFNTNRKIEIENNNTLCNIAIAAAVTAGARVFRSKFKNMPEYTLYYSDTDSIDIDKPLPEEYVGNELGQFKLEDIFDESVYLAPKM